MKILSQFVGTVILFVFLLVIAETMAFLLPINIEYIASMLALAMTSSYFVYKVVNREKRDS